MLLMFQIFTGECFNFFPNGSNMMWLKDRNKERKTKQCRVDSIFSDLLSVIFFFLLTNAIVIKLKNREAVQGPQKLQFFWSPWQKNTMKAEI